MWSTTSRLETRYYNETSCRRQGRRTRKKTAGLYRTYMIVVLSTTFAILQSEHRNILKTGVSLNELKPYTHGCIVFYNKFCTNAKIHTIA